MTSNSMFDDVRKPLISFGLGFAYRYALDSNDTNSAFMYASILGVSHIVSDKIIATLLPEFENSSLNDIKNMTTIGGITGGVNAGLQLMLMKDPLYLENGLVGAGASIASIVLEPTFKSII